MSNKEMYEEITNRIVTSLKEGQADPAKWVKMWQSLSHRQRSAANRDYNGINALLLAFKAEACGYDVPVWATLKQWGAYKGRVRKGEKGTRVVLWRKITKKDEKGNETDDSFMMMKTFNVFNIAQVDGVESCPGTRRVAVINPDGRNAEADLWITSTGIKVGHGGDRAFYRPSEDAVTLPVFEDFKDGPSYYATAAHELAHATGHADRLDRDMAGRFGSASYAMEELVAELSAAFSMGRLAIEAEPREDHAHYIASWIKALQDDHTAINKAASMASKATDYLFGGPSKEGTDIEEKTTEEVSA
jgi:antirestriction protein ArdC